MLGGGPTLALMSLTLFSWKVAVMIFAVWVLIWIWAIIELAEGVSVEVNKKLKEIGEEE